MCNMANQRLDELCKTENEKLNTQITTHVVSCVGKFVYNIDKTDGNNSKCDEEKRGFPKEIYGKMKKRR